jgi:hypothetical protein
MYHISDASADLRARFMRTLFRRALVSGWAVSPAPWQWAEFIGRSDIEMQVGDQDERPRAALHSVLHVMDLDSRETCRLTLVPNGTADPGSGKIPIFSPLGMALLGRRKGQMAEAQFMRCSIRLVILDVAPTAREDAP